MSSSPAECILVKIRRDFFMGTKIDLRKARELATLDELSTSRGMAEPYAR